MILTQAIQNAMVNDLAARKVAEWLPFPQDSRDGSGRLRVPLQARRSQVGERQTEANAELGCPRGGQDLD